MTLKTVTVTGQIYNPDGTPAAGVEGYATLNQPETDNGIVIPTSTFIKANADGKFSIQLWPNARGSGQSQYIVRAYTRRASVLNLVIMVPDVDVPVVITDIAIAQPYPPIDQSLQALLDVQAASVIAQAAKLDAESSADAAFASEEAAALSESNAEQSAQTATDKAGEASTSAQSALESKNAAALSKQNAVQAKDDAVAAKDKAEAWAENPVDAEVETGQYSAKHYAIKAEQSALSAEQSKADAESAKSVAEEKALAASGSATSAGQSASNAAGSALSASEDRIAAQQSAGQAAGSADEAAASKTKAQQWASNPENAPVEGSLYSALHYASKASTSAQNAADSADEALGYKNTAETAKTDAQSARAKAAQWAENPTDTEVEPGQYSAKHHASKAADSADEAEQSAQAAADSAASVDASVIPLPNRVPKSNDDGLLDDGWMNLAPLRVQVLNALYPDGIYPSLDLRFVGADRINNPNVSFSRASKATYWDKDGILREADIDEPRFDYDPVTGEALGLLRERASTNLLLNSAIVTTQTVIVPAGNMSISFYGTGSISLSGAATGTLVGTGSNNVRVSLPITTTAGSLVVTVAGGSPLMGQLETTFPATSYIPTTGTAATRAADVITYAKADNSPLFPNGEFSCVIDYDTEESYASNRMVLALTTQTGEYGLLYSANRFLTRSPSLSIDPNIGLSIGRNRVSLSANSTTKKGCKNGGSPLINTPLDGITNTELVNKVNFSSGLGTSQYNGHLRSFQLYNRALPDTKLQELSQI